jgi:hypothetical protein
MVIVGRLLNRRFWAIAVAMLSSSMALVSAPTNSFAEYRCTSWGYTDWEARVELGRLTSQYYQALEREQDPSYEPTFSERSSEEINSDISSIISECIPEIKGHVKAQLDSNYPLSFSGGSGMQCLSDYPMSRATARANLNAINDRIVMIGSLQNELQLSGQTVNEMIADERRTGQIFQDCYDYFEQTGQTEEEPQPEHQQPVDTFIDPNSECIIATAAFGSNLAPQVQFLRSFRDNHILSTAAGSSFMTAFNGWYYSFSPAVADYERGQPWMQAGVRTAIHPLLGILQASEKAYSSIPGEFGAMAAGLIASAMIGAVYFSPIALSIKQVRKSKINYRLAAGIVAIPSAALVASIMAGDPTALMISSSAFVLCIIGISAILSSKAIVRLYNKARAALRK